jgi:hypothetical protein
MFADIEGYTSLFQKNEGAAFKVGRTAPGRTFNKLLQQAMVK